MKTSTWTKTTEDLQVAVVRSGGGDIKGMIQDKDRRVNNNDQDFQDGRGVSIRSMDGGKETELEKGPPRAGRTLPYGHVWKVQGNIG